MAHTHTHTHKQRNKLLQHLKANKTTQTKH
jgi:hypothetical protein